MDPLMMLVDSHHLCIISPMCGGIKFQLTTSVTWVLAITAKVCAAVLADLCIWVKLDNCSCQRLNLILSTRCP
jgi:hypothetical protein